MPFVSLRLLLAALVSLLAIAVFAPAMFARVATDVTTLFERIVR